MISKTKLYSIVSKQFPEFVQADYRKFIAFVEAYYKFLDAYQGDVYEQRNIDTAYNSFLKYFRKELSNGMILPGSNERFNLSNIKQLYSTKGTEEAFRIIFRIFFNEEITIAYPSEQVLRASDGVWVQETNITLLKIFGSLPNVVEYIHVDNSFGQFKVPITSVLPISDATTRFSFNSVNRVVFDNNQLVKILNEAGNVIYAGNLIETPAKIKIVNGGTGWKRGQVIVFPGGVKDTTIRVTNVENSTGKILNLEILELGYPHLKNQTYTVSPYSVKSTRALITTSKEIIGISPIAYKYTLNLTDYVDSISDETVGTTNSIDPELYNFDNYKQLGYYGKETLASNHLYATPLESDEDLGVTIQDWDSSRTILEFTFESTPKSKGEYKVDRGQVSNDKSVLQDNYYFQNFSYVIETQQPISKYKNIVPLFHPTGTIQFSTLLKSQLVSVNSTISRSLSVEKIDITDVATIDAAEYWHLTKPLSSALTPSAEITSKHLTKPFVDSTENLEFISKHFTKVTSDSINPVTDAKAFTLTKLLTDSSSTSETLKFEITKDALLDVIQNLSENVSLTANKYVVDSISADSPDTALLSVISYNDDTYFADNYFGKENVLTIGQ